MPNRYSTGEGSSVGSAHPTSLHTAGPASGGTRALALGSPGVCQINHHFTFFDGNRAIPHWPKPDYKGKRPCPGLIDGFERAAILGLVLQNRYGDGKTMTTSSDTTPVTSPDNDGLPSQPSRKASNLQWILGVTGGAISAVLIGVGIYHPDSQNTFLVGVAIFLYLACGIAIGSVVPRVGCLAGLGAIIGIIVSSIALAHSAPLKYTVPGQNDDFMQRFYWLLPLVGGVIGLLWQIVVWVRRRRNPGQSSPSDGEATAAIRQDRLRLAWTSLFVGVALGFGFGVLIGGPFFIAVPILGAIAGGSIFVILAISAYLSTIFK